MRFAIALLTLLLVSACSPSASVQSEAPSPSPLPTATTVPATATPILATATRAAPTAVPTVASKQPPVAPEVLARAYVHALYARDQDLMAALFPRSEAASDRDEYHLDLLDMHVRPISAEEAGDRNPVTRLEYAEAKARVAAKGKEGIYTYRVATRLTDGRRTIAGIYRLIDWP